MGSIRLTKRTLGCIREMQREGNQYGHDPLGDCNMAGVLFGLGGPADLLVTNGLTASRASQ